MQITQIPFEQLKISKLNPRYSEPPPDTSHIKPTIKARGILQPLLVRLEDKHYGVVFGRSRWFSVKEIRAEGGSFETVPCVIMKSGDDADALEAGIIENCARSNPAPMTEYENFVHLIKMGRTIEGIAQTFGIKPHEVKQRLALGNLLSKIREGYRQGDIDDDTVCHLTMASKAQQKEWCELWEKRRAPHGHQLKMWLLGGQPISTKVALFPLDDHKTNIVENLFEDGGYFKDPKKFFWPLQSQAIAAKADAMRAEGWANVIVQEIGRHFDEHDYEKTPKEKGGSVYITVSHHGDVEVHDGWMTRKEARHAAKLAEKAEKAKEKGKKADTAKEAADPTITSAMQSYLDLHRHALVRVALTKQPGMAFRLLVAHAAASSGNWRVKADPQVARSPEVKASVTKAPAQSVFDAERKAVQALLRGTGIAGNGTEAMFARLLKLTDAQVMRVAAWAMAETLAAGSEVVDAAGTVLKVDARTLWKPDDTFFDLVRDRASLNAMLAEVGGKELAKANIAEKGKTQKAIIRDFLAGKNGRKKVEGWLPGWMAFPFRQLGAAPVLKVIAKGKDALKGKARKEPQRIAA